MSNFACEYCGRTQLDKDGVGYVSGCSHYPPEGRFRDTFVNIWFGEEDEIPKKAFYCGAWYKSDEARRQGRAVHPVAWDAEFCDHGNDIDLETHYDDVRILAKDVICGTETAMNISRVKPKMSIREIAERAGIDITDIQGEDIDVLTGKRTHND